ncbi:MAG: TerC/Alx family metal homeostasis membrane protein [Bacteroidetes bacterium]|jgi:tellurite resistance protein TerC|nr:TerC/Alx family metal homeostasis membrane protein [Bacteroidota bacterium]MBT5529837.1 TerC/Alx family metal homeostasis membrane protein [Cytophagia bacterium]MBT3422471.1 TerC/Alx family metal homeostasis membrane protein [Bacteroidota bacterium]MBT3799916.1 TerC/Alx family metal homeostasis membrane protein [Bacteroidota bacterium]MBT3935886.1 TerC/Alx family metal homeostasis membrane protein [Bacteroidota bacterium]
MFSQEVIFFGLFLVGILTILLFDLGVFTKTNHIVTFKEATIWTTIWVSLSIGFYFFILLKGELIHGIENIDDIREKIALFKHPILISDDFESSIKIYRKNLSLEYITGYLIEYALSVDNIFVIIMILISFNVQEKYYKKVLFWGILGAIIMRFIFIFLSAALIQKFGWVLYIFGGLLIFTGIRMFLTRNEEEKINTADHPIVKFASKFFRVYPHFVVHRFFISKNKKIQITPLFLVLLVIEFTDVIFAVDSVPAIFSITKDPYIVFFSNIFAILGLRSLFFLVMNIINIFHYLKLGLSFLLTFIGAKMLVHHWLEEIGFTTAHSLYVVLGILSLSILASVIFPKKKVVDNLEEKSSDQTS